MRLDAPWRWYVTVMGIHFLSRDNIHVAAGDFDALRFWLYLSCIAGELAHHWRCQEGRPADKSGHGDRHSIGLNPGGAGFKTGITIGSHRRADKQRLPISTAEGTGDCLPAGINGVQHTSPLSQS